MRYAGGRTRKGFNVGEHKTELFNIFGSTDVTKLGLGLEDLDAASMSKTSDFWKKNGTGTFNKDQITGVTGNDGKIELRGRLKVEDLALTVKQSVFSGFYVQLYAPLRSVKVDQVGFKNLGKTNIPATALYSMETFIKDDFPTILKENGFKPFTTFDKSFFKKTTVPEMLFSAGWQGMGSESFGIIDLVRGFLQAGALVPLSGRKNVDDLFSIPLGYNDYWGFNFQASGEVALWKMVVGGHAGVSVFIPSERSVRMKSDESQTGWFVLGKGRAKVDRGAVWDLSGYIKMDRVFSGLSFLVGYSFTRKEDTQLTIRDEKFLSTVVKAGLDHEDSVGTKRPRFISKNKIINSDVRLRGWNQQTVHAMAEFNAKGCFKSRFAPVVRIEYSYPVVGRRAFATDMIGGTLGLQVSWDV